RFRTEPGAPPAAQQLAHVVEREAQPMELIDPAQPLHRARLVEAEPAARARGRLQQPQLLIEMDRADGLAGLRSQIADAEEMGAVIVAGRTRTHTLTFRLESGWKVLDSRRKVNLAG